MQRIRNKSYLVRVQYNIYRLTRFKHVSVGGEYRPDNSCATTAVPTGNRTIHLIDYSSNRLRAGYTKGEFMASAKLQPAFAPWNIQFSFS